MQRNIMLPSGKRDLGEPMFPAKDFAADFWNCRRSSLCSRNFSFVGSYSDSYLCYMWQFVALERVQEASRRYARVPRF